MASSENAAVDFCVTWKGTEEQLQTDIFDQLINNPLDNDMPIVVLGTGKSGRGKSRGVQQIIDELFKNKGIDYAPFVKKITVMTPLEYAEKLKAILNEKELKKIDKIILDEARTIVGTSNWNTFINQAISHVNATSRAIKPIALFVITQNLKDIDPATRRIVDLWLKFDRGNGTKPTITPYVLYFDDKNPENPVLRRRRLKGTVIDENGLATTVFPVFHLNRVREEVDAPYRELMLSAKQDYLDNLIDRLISKIKKEVGETQTKQVEALEKHFLENPEQLREWAEFKKGKWKLKKSSREGLNINAKEAVLLEEKLVNAFKEQDEKEKKKSEVLFLGIKQGVDENANI